MAKKQTRTRTHKHNDKSSPFSREFKSFVCGLTLTLVVVFALTVQGGCSSSGDGQNPPPDNGTVKHYDGLQKVTTNPDFTEAVLNHYAAIKVSFNADHHIPNWVSWELTRDHTNGPVARTDNFLNDPRVYGCPTTYDYTRSGYDRGHMSPAADNRWSETAMKECFYMTNICPQVHEMNAGAWEVLEQRCRQWAVADSAIVIVCGPVLTDNLTERIGTIGVTVPQRYFKVIVAPYSNPPRGIGFIMNNGEVPGGIQACAHSIDEVEQITGHDFFHTLPDDLEQQLESQCNFTQWSTIK